MFNIVCVLTFVTVATAIRADIGYKYGTNHNGYYGVGYYGGGYGGHYDNGHYNGDYYEGGLYGGHHGDHYSTPNYSFDYGVKDPHTGDNKKQWESRHGDVVKGGYMLDEADGTKRIVEYTADKHHGFNAIVKKIGHAHHPQTYAKHWGYNGGHYDGHYDGHYNGGYKGGYNHGHGHGAISHSNLYQH